jgi:RND family efflux transporter MFP subunit
MGVIRKSVSMLPALMLLSACGGAPDHDPRTDAPLVSSAVAVAAARQSGGLTGVVAARIESDLGFRVGGKIARRLVDAGQTVRAGQALMQIEANDLALGATAQNRLAQAAAARLDLARRDEQRMRPIAEKGFASRRQYDATRAALDAATADYAAAQAQSGVAGNAAGYALLRADSDGVIAAVLAEPGQVVAAGQPVLRLARSGAREAVVAIPENMRAGLGRSAMAFLYGGQGAVPATLRQLSAQADPATRTYEARYILSGTAQAASLGSTVTIHPGRTAGAAAVSVPVGALHDPGAGTGVWVIGSGRDPTVHFRPVHVASLQEERALIDRGLRPGDRVVALGAHLLHEGDRVRLKK